MCRSACRSVCRSPCLASAPGRTARAGRGHTAALYKKLPNSPSKTNAELLSQIAAETRASSSCDAHTAPPSGSHGTSVASSSPTAHGCSMHLRCEPCGVQPVAALRPVWKYNGLFASAVLVS
eukprot:5682723-Prymnesium_polylepis.1